MPWELDGPATFGMSVIVFIIIPFWFFYSMALFLTKGPTRAIISLLGLTVLASCISWGVSSDLAQQVTSEHAIIASASHRPRLALTLLLSALTLAAVVWPFKTWGLAGSRAPYQAAFIAVPAIGAYVAYIWTMAAYYGFATLFRP